jgi:hypothetical protein
MNENIKMGFSKYLLKDTNEIKKLTTLYEKEEEYAIYLCAIEDSIAFEFLENKKLTDKEVINVLTNLKKNYDKDASFFKTNLEKKIFFSFSKVLKEYPITRHEMRLVFNYILWSIDNRNWIPDKQAYVKWLTHSMRFMDDEERQKYEDEFRKLGKSKGIPQNQIEAMLKKEIIDDSELIDENITISESEFFNLDEEDKFDYVVENIMINVNLFKVYFEELVENSKFEKAIELNLKVLEIVPNFPLFELNLCELYFFTNQKELCLYHIKNIEETLSDNEVKKILEKEEYEMIKEGIENIKKNLGIK